MKHKLRILSLEDDPADAELLCEALRAEWPDCEVVRVETREAFRAALEQGGFDLILSDNTLPTFAGREALVIARTEYPEIPFIYVSGTIGEEAAIESLRAGARDYVLKHQLAALVPAVQRVLREAEDHAARHGAEEALRRSEEQVRRLVDSSLDMIIAVDLDRRVTQFNPAAEMVFGYRKQEVLGQPADLLYANPEEGRHVHETTVLNGQHVREVVNRRKSGEVFPSLLAASVLKEADGRLAGVMGISRDITRQKQAEEHLRQQQRFQASILEALPVGVWYMDTRRKLQLVNPADQVIWAGETGVPAERLQEFKSWQNDLIQQVIAQEWGIIRVLREGATTSAEAHEVLGFDGRRRFILHSAVPLLGADNQTQGALAINQDLTQSVLANEQIRDQAALLDKARDAILVCDLEQRISYWNDSAARLYGWTAEEARGQKVMDLFLAPAPDNLAAAESRFLERGEWVGEMTQRTKSGGSITVESRWTLVRDDAGQPKAKLVINTDITAKKELEAQFLRAQRLESIGMLASGIAHDLNNMLAPIMMAVTLLRDQFKEPIGIDLLNTLESSAQRGAGLVQQILSFARGQESGRQPIQLTHLIGELTKVIRDTFPKSIHFQRRVDPRLWLVEAHLTQMHQVLLNLCLNARDAMPQGGRLTLTAENIRVDELNAQTLQGLFPGPFVLLKVQDTGTGISRVNLEKIFQPFFTTKAEGQGTGLGLSSVLGIVKNHNGVITVDSQEGRGTTFSVYLPATATSTAAAPAEAAPALPRGNGETILMAEDEAGVQEVILKSLTRHGYRVLAANDGAEAMAVFAQNASDIRLVLTDVNMPYMDGAALIRAVRKLAPDMKILVMTGLAENFDSVQFSSGRPIAVLHKPFDSRSLLMSIHATLHETKP